MTRFRSSLARISAVLCAVGCALPATAGAGEIIVRRDAGLSAAERAEIRADAGVEHERMLRLPDSEVVSVPAREEKAALAALNADPDVRYAERVVRYRLASLDMHFGNQWAHVNTGQPLRGQSGTPGVDMDVPQAWEVSRGAGQHVAIVDSGIHQTHPDLAANVDPNPRSFVPGQPATGDPPGHGTKVAGVIAAVADNQIGIAGIAPQAKVLSLKAFANEVGDVAAIAEAMDYAGDLDIPIVNLSASGPGASQAVYDAIASHPGTLYVVAAGHPEDLSPGLNIDAGAPQYPCSYALPNIVCVGASDFHDNVTSWSHRGPLSVDLFAPGERIFTTTPASFTLVDGTSMSAPMVSAEAALLLAARPNLTTASVKHLVLRAVEPINAPHSVTGGRANAGKLLTTPIEDAEGDGVIDVLDNCLAAANRDQTNADGDGAGDVCDATPRGDDVDRDGKPSLDDRCPTVFGTAPDGCPGSAPPGGQPRTPTAAARVLSIKVAKSPQRCPRGKTCRKTAKVTVRLSRAATIALKVEQRTKRKGKTVWKRITSRSLRPTTASRSLTVRRLARGSYRVTVTLAGKKSTYSFRV